MKKFRTIEISNPEFKKNDLRFLTVKSKNLLGRGDVIVSEAEKRQEDIPVIIFLHGVYGSAWSWPLQSGVHIQVRDMVRKKIIPPVMLVFPSDGLWGDGSGYVPHDGCDFEKWIAEDVPEVVMQQFPGVTHKSKFFITGLSMGGFGALKIGAKYHDRFAAFSGHSSITNLSQMKLFAEEDINHYLQKDVSENDVFQTLEKYKSEMGNFRFDCGDKDALFKANKELHRQLKKAKIAHDFQVFEGGHEWPYWEKHISRSVLFFANEM